MWDTILKIALGLAAAGAVATAAVVIHKQITKRRIEEEAKRQYKEAFKAKIKSKDTKHVDVGIYSKNNNHLGDMTIESDEGVASDLKVGQVIYC